MSRVLILRYPALACYNQLKLSPPALYALHFRQVRRNGAVPGLSDGTKPMRLCASALGPCLKHVVARWAP